MDLEKDSINSPIFWNNQFFLGFYEFTDKMSCIFTRVKIIMLSLQSGY